MLYYCDYNSNSESRVSRGIQRRPGPPFPAVLVYSILFYYCIILLLLLLYVINNLPQLRQAGAGAYHLEGLPIVNLDYIIYDNKYI